MACIKHVYLDSVISVAERVARESSQRRRGERERERGFRKVKATVVVRSFRSAPKKENRV